MSSFSFSEKEFTNHHAGELNQQFSKLISTEDPEEIRKICETYLHTIGKAFTELHTISYDR
jgi:hypothetical protein